MPKSQDYYRQCPEALLVSLAREGDRSSFEELVKRRQSQLRNLMWRLSGNAQLADDLAQQVLLQVWSRMHTLNQPAAFGGWFKRIAVSIWLQYLRKQDVLHNAEEFIDDSVEALPRNDALKLDLDQALATLPPLVRSCIVLCYQEGESHSEISQMLDLPIGTVKSHINRGANRLRNILADYRVEASEVKDARF